MWRDVVFSSWLRRARARMVEWRSDWASPEAEKAEAQLKQTHRGTIVPQKMRGRAKDPRGRGTYVKIKSKIK